MKKLALAAVLILGLLLGGCAPAVKSFTVQDKALLGMGNLEMGMLKENVLDLMGSPYYSETVYGVEYLTFQIEPCLERYCFLPVGLEDGTVIGWGRRFYENTTGLEFWME